MPSSNEKRAMQARRRRALPKLKKTVAEVTASVTQAEALIDAPLLRQRTQAYRRYDLPEARAWLLDAKAGIEAAIREMEADDDLPV